MISSNRALIFSYVLYLLGRTELNVPEHDLRRAIARWLFMSLLTGRYTGSPEAAMDYDLANLRGAKTAEDILGILDAACASVLTPNFWSITLPSELATSSGRSPSMFGYFAALVLLDAKVLLSEQKVADRSRTLSVYRCLIGSGRGKAGSERWATTRGSEGLFTP